jgi:competence protein ComEA
VFDPDRRHLIAYVAAAAVLVVIASRFVGRDAGSQPVPSISMAAPASASPAGARPRAPARAKPLIWVDVAGAVRRPGLYSLPDGSRVAAAIERAGGVGRRANRAAVNLAAKLMDGQQVFVPARGSSGGGAVASGGGAHAGGGIPSGAAAGASGPGAAASGAPISLSNATQEQLETLDGIGPALAQRIIEYREQHGGFRSIDELQEVSGIGAKRFEALRDSIAP